MEWNSTFTCTGTLSGQLDGNLNWTGTLSVAPSTQAILDFDTPQGINWTSGGFSGDGTLKNMGVLNYETNTSKAIGGLSTLMNEGIININSTGIQFVGYGSPTINNTSSGIINLNASSGSIQAASGQGTIINTGIIKRKQGTGIYGINIPLENHDGTISVESGTLQIQNTLTEFTDGTYNVTLGSTLDWNATFTCLGTLTGQIDGSLEWTGTLTVAQGTNATLAFHGPAGVKWLSGGFNGDGTLTNTGVINMESASAVAIGGQSIFRNEGDFNINTSGVLFIAYGTPTFLNTDSGILNITSDGSIQAASGNGNIVNTGIIKKVTNTGNYSIASNMTNNSPGKIIAETGLLNLTGTFIGDGTITGNGNIQLVGNTSFNGTISPGGFPGTLTYIGNYTSSSNTIMLSEIYGPTAGTEYDVFAVQGNAIMDGNIVVAVYNEINLDDEFVVVTANSITSCNLPATVSANNDGTRYTFDVICNPDNVTLKVNNILLGTDENSLSNLVLYPNPSNGQFTIDLGREYTDVNVQVYNMLGQQISSEKYASAKIIEKEINASAGIYFVKVSTAKEGSNTLRIIKQ
ncbi:T9SS type A sorting domain-containing protein [Aequorivita sp. CIP111184]|uniref:T9SS type A sorting domain-containing protein n=1 Tax=Aequorivita sp. CIP111184 TaxID=2211356 RepID=UPI000DBC13D7|nr:T9SS type A sorting domain-containing protein [Aequorivita sp. CIP111184]SRX54184.1 hypothetical protein AEQU1_01189 [Aequorivita sp. CIP111184]